MASRSAVINQSRRIPANLRVPMNLEHLRAEVASVLAAGVFPR